MAKLSDLTESNRRTVLVYGNSGSGKTVFAHSFPGRIFTFDFDGKVSSAAKFLKGTEQLEKIEYESYIEKGDFGKAYKKLWELRELAKKGDFPYGTIILDSITTFADSLMAEVIRQNPGDSGKRSKVNETLIPHLKDYQIAISHVKEVIRQILALPANIVATGHMHMDKDETTGEILYQPLIWGKDLPSWLPLVFEEVYRTYTETDPKTGTKYLAQTRAERKYISRTQIRNLPNPLDITGGYEAMKKYF